MKMTARNSAIGAMTRNSSGSDRPVTTKNTITVCPLEVSRSNSRNAWVTQMTPVSVRRTITNAELVIRST